MFFNMLTWFYANYIRYLQDAINLQDVINIYIHLGLNDVSFSLAAANLITTAEYLETKLFKRRIDCQQFSQTHDYCQFAESPVSF